MKSEFNAGHAVPKRGWMAIASALALGLVARSAPAQTMDTDVSVQVLDDQLRPIEGARVQLSEGARKLSYSTSGTGQTPWASFDPDRGAELVVRDTETPFGTALGLKEVLPAPQRGQPEDDYFNWEISRTQPLASPLYLEGSPDDTNNYGPPVGSAGHWVIAVGQGSNLSFPLRVAPVLDRQAIDHYLAYRGKNGAPAYVRGLAMVCPSVDLGPNGIVIGINRLGDLTGQEVAIDGYNFYSTGAAPGGAGSINDQETTPLGVEVYGEHQGFVYLRLYGVLRAGHLGVFLRAGRADSGQIYLRPDLPPALAPFSPPGDAGPSAACRDCVPDDAEPPSNWECDATVTGESCPVEYGSKNCQVVKTRTKVFCGVGGETKSGSTSVTSAWKVSFQFSGEVGNDTVKLRSGSGFEYGRKRTSTRGASFEFRDGAYGCGICMRYYRFYLVCAQKYMTYRSKIDWTGFFGDHPIINPCLVPRESYVTCTDETVSQSVCSRRPG